ncbi:MAG: Ig-like domain-containing protein, partial [Chitinophagales bacterium]|nr:Ig-like domain-containing protein [Chitinophagales bacterium]
MAKATKFTLFSLLTVICTNLLNAQVVAPFRIVHQTTQKGSFRYLANTITTCQSGGTCATAQSTPPPGGNFQNNSYTMVYVDIDGDPSTFSSSSDSLVLPPCSEVTWAGIFWGGQVNTSTPNYAIRDSIRIRANNGPYVGFRADSLRDNTVGYTSYHCYKDITAFVKANQNARFTVANVVARTGASNLDAGWMICVVYRNDNEDMRNMYVYNGLVNVSGSLTVDVPISGFLTPPSGPVNLDFGFFVHDGDRLFVGDSLLFNGNGNFVPVFDALNPADDVFNSTVTRQGVATPFRLPNYGNLLGTDADIIRPNNNGFAYIGNSDTSAVLRLKTGGETYLTQALTIGIDVYEADVRLANVATDINGGALNVGDTIEYTITLKNIGSDTSFNTVILDTLPFNVDYVPGSLRISYGPNSGPKTDASGDDQAEFISSSKTIRYRIGRNATASVGGQVGNSPLGDDSTVVKFRVTVIRDCRKLNCSLVIPNRAWATGVSKISGNNYKAGSNPAIFDSLGCPIPGSTIITANANGCTPVNDTTLTNVCPSVLIDISADTLNHPGYSYFNSSFAPVSGLVSPGIYYGIANITGTCNDTIQITAIVVNCAPVANGDNGTTNEDTPVTLPNILSNDNDPNGPLNPANIDLDPNTPGIQQSETTPQGTWTVNPTTGQVTFTPAPNFNGVETNIYEICDGGTPNLCDTAVITINVTPVNDPPVANGDNGTTNEDTPVTLPNILSNDTDVDNTLDPANIDLDPNTPGIQQSETTPQGTWTVNPTTGEVTFTPAPNFNGTATNIYQICDGGTPNLCDTAVITINVSPVNDPPVANGDNGTTNEDSPVTLPNILSNDTDPDNTLDPANIDLDPNTPGIQQSET